MPNFDQTAIIRALKSVLPSNGAYTALHEPVFSGNEWIYVKKCLDSTWVSSVGSFVDRFEQQLVDYTGAKCAIAVVNGTAALQICLELVGVERNDEVIVPTLTFVATANAVTYCGAIPHFVDSDSLTLGLDPRKLQQYLDEIAGIQSGNCINKITGRRIRAVLPMHTFGHPVDLDPLIEICSRYHLELVEDAAESLGSYYKGKHTGTLGRTSALSFNGNKIVTTGGGGAILTNDKELGQLAKHLTTTAKLPHEWAFVHDRVGYNYRLPNINAALGCAQLEQLETFVQNKRALAEQYRKAFDGISGIRFFTEPWFAKSNYWLNTLVLEKQSLNLRDSLLRVTNDAGIMTRPPWTLMHELEMYRANPRMEELQTAEDLEQRLINIPSSAKLGMPHVQA